MIEKGGGRIMWNNVSSGGGKGYAKKIHGRGIYNRMYMRGPNSKECMGRIGEGCTK